MRILFVFTGGTIGSTVSGDYIGTDDNKPYKLIEEYNKKYGLEHDYDVVSPFTVLSELNTGRTISRLIKCVYDLLQTDNEKCKEDERREGYAGVVITHGTDTLPYSAAALSLAFGNDSVPICFVSSNYPIEDKRANAIDNLYGAIKLIESSYRSGKDRGVFVSYRNHDGVIYIHRGTMLLETMAFSDEYFSMRGNYYGSVSDKRFSYNDDYHEACDGDKPMGCVTLDDVCTSVVRLKAYPGMPVTDVLSECGENGMSCVLLETYHSGTVNTEYDAYRGLFVKLHEQGVPVYLTGVVRGISYESTRSFNELCLTPIYDLSPVAAYMKLWMSDKTDK